MSAVTVFLRVIQNPVMLTIATVLLCVAALLASLIPASRAASIEPMMALRNE